MKQARNKFIASVLALVLAFGLLTGGAFAWLSTGDFTSSFRVGVAQVGVGVTLEGASTVVRGEESTVRGGFSLDSGSRAVRLENIGLGAVQARIVVKAADAEAANKAGITLRYGDRQNDVTSFTQYLQDVVISLGSVERSAVLEVTLTLSGSDYSLPMELEFAAI